jgi:serine/threonine protein kinase
MNQEVLSNGRYVVQRRLATGGMGEVLLAEFGGDAELSPGLLVVKRILSAAPGQAPAEGQVRMLLEEGRLGQRLNHENLVETFRLDTDGQSPLLVIELLAGRSMAQVLGQAKKRKEMVPPDVAVAILRGACCGLHFAHTLKGPDGRSLGLVHRDVSPANIFVTFDGKVKVIDFGVAKSDDSEVKTATGILKGKLGYMSPEQSLGASKLTPQADVWSLGVFFWEMLLAERLFSSPNPTATLLQISQKDIPRPRDLRGDLPPAVEALAMGMLERNLEARFQSCADVVRAIDALPGINASTVDVGGWLAGRFPDEAVAGAADAARCARRRGRLVVARGLADGNAGSDPADDDEFATAVLPASLRDQLLASLPTPQSQGAGDDEHDDAATIRVSSDIVAQLRNRMGPGVPTAEDDDDDVATRRVDADMVRALREGSQTERNPVGSSTQGQRPSTQPRMPVPTQPSPSPSSASFPAAPSWMAQGQPVAQSPSQSPSGSLPAAAGPGGRRSGMQVTPMGSGSSPPAPQRPSTVSATLPAAPMRPSTESATIPAAPWRPVTETPARPAAPQSSWLAVAVGTFGALVVLMGIAFSSMTPAAVPRTFVSYLDPAGFTVVVADHSHVPIGRASEELDPAHASLLKAGELEVAAVPAALLEERLKSSGVWARASLPSTSKAKTAAMLPLIIVAIGLLALAFAVPSVLMPAGGRRLGLQGLLMALSVALVLVMLQRGGLSWPGYAAWSHVPHLEWR